MNDYSGTRNIAVEQMLMQGRMNGFDGELAEQIARLSLQGQGRNRGNRMSQSDGIQIQKNEPDAPGVYVSQDQMLQDNYTQSLAMQQQRSEQPSLLQQLVPKAVNQNTNANPNYQVVEGPRHAMVGPNGQLIYK